MKLKMNSKGDSTSDIFYFLVGSALVVIGLLLLFSMSNAEKKDNMQEISMVKEGYQTIQLARTYLQTPLNFSGETKTVSVWANIYFQMSDYKEKNELRLAMFDLARLTIKPHLRTGLFDSEASFTYYYLETEQEKLIVASTWAESSKDLQQEGVFYSDDSQANVKIQIPVYEEGNQFNPSDKYIIFEIRTTDDKHESTQTIYFN